MPSSGLFELSAITGGVGHMVAADVLPIVDVNDATQAPQGSVVKITLAQLYRTEFTPVTVSTPLPDIAQTWNAGAVTFTAVKLNITDTASAAASLLLDLQVGGVSKFSVRKDGTVTVGIVTAPAGTLTGTTLAANVVASSLTSVGTLAALTVTPGATSVQALAAQTLTVNAGSHQANIAIQNASVRFGLLADGQFCLGDGTTDLVVFADAGNAIKLVTGGATRLLVSSGGIVLVGTATITGAAAGDLVLGGKALFTTAVSLIVPGATSISLRNNANNADNLIVLDNGNTTVRGTLSATGGITGVAASSLTGTTLAANVVTSSLTSVGTLASLTVGAGATALGGSLAVTGAAGINGKTAIANVAAPSAAGVTYTSNEQTLLNDLRQRLINFGIYT